MPPSRKRGRARSVSGKQRMTCCVVHQPAKGRCSKALRSQRTYAPGAPAQDTGRGQRRARAAHLVLQDARLPAGRLEAQRRAIRLVTAALHAQVAAHHRLRAPHLSSSPFFYLGVGWSSRLTAAHPQHDDAHWMGSRHWRFRAGNWCAKQRAARLIARDAQAAFEESRAVGAHTLHADGACTVSISRRVSSCARAETRTQ